MALPKASNTLAPIPYNILRRLTLSEQNELRAYIEDITEHAVHTDTTSVYNAPQQSKDDHDIIRLAFYVIITVATVLAVLTVYNACGPTPALP